MVQKSFGVDVVQKSFGVDVDYEYVVAVIVIMFDRGWSVLEAGVLLDLAPAQPVVRQHHDSRTVHSAVRQHY